MYLSVVIPAYNEAKRIGTTLTAVGEWLARQSYDSEIVVVDNRSTDDTADIAIGSLAVPGAVVLAGGQEPLWRQLLGKLGNLWIQFWAVPGIWDTQRGFKVFTGRAAQIIFPRVTIGKWGFDVEVLAIAREHRLKIKEFPVRWNNPAETRVTMWTYPEVLWETVRVFWGRIMGNYR